jgi:hypothetical protein
MGGRSDHGLTHPIADQRSCESGTASATSPTTGRGCDCTAAPGGRLIAPQDYDTVPHAWWRRAHKQDVETLQQHGVHSEEVSGQHALGLSTQELRPHQSRPLGRRSNSGALQDGPHRAGPDPVLVPEAAQLAVDPAIPQVELSLASRSTSLRISADTAGRPRRCGEVQRRRTKSRCHRSSVVGCTNNPRQTRRGSSRASPANTARSAQSIRGRATWRRSTATSWRNMSSSASLATELRDSSTSHRSTWHNSG